MKIMQFGSRNTSMGCICKVVRVNSSNLPQQVVSLDADRRFVPEKRQLTLDVTLGAA